MILRLICLVLKKNNVRLLLRNIYVYSCRNKENWYLSLKIYLSRLVVNMWLRHLCLQSTNCRARDRWDCLAIEHALVSHNYINLLLEYVLLHSAFCLQLKNDSMFVHDCERAWRTVEHQPPDGLWCNRSGWKPTGRKRSKWTHIYNRFVLLDWAQLYE